MDFVFFREKDCAVSAGFLLVWMYVLHRDSPSDVKRMLEHHHWGEALGADVGMIDPNLDRLMEVDVVARYLQRKARELAEAGLQVSRAELRAAGLGGDSGSWTSDIDLEPGHLYLERLSTLLTNENENTGATDGLPGA